jgi:hypothetical protein
MLLDFLYIALTARITNSLLGSILTRKNSLLGMKLVDMYSEDIISTYEQLVANNAIINEVKMDFIVLLY